MVKQVFDVEQYWKVIVYYNLDYDLFDYVEEEMREMGIDEKTVSDVYDVMRSGEAKAVTLSSLSLHASIVLFNKHDSKTDYINSIVHEAEHVKQAMLKAYEVNDEGELPAYTIGYLIGRMYPILRNIICCD